MIEINPHECLDVLEPPRNDVKTIRVLLTADETNFEQLKVTSRQIADAYADGKGERIDQVYGLALHVERWCDEAEAV